MDIADSIESRHFRVENVARIAEKGGNKLSSSYRSVYFKTISFFFFVDNFGLNWMWVQRTLKICWINNSQRSWNQTFSKRFKLFFSLIPRRKIYGGKFLVVDLVVLEFTSIIFAFKLWLIIIVIDRPAARESTNVRT